MTNELKLVAESMHEVDKALLGLSEKSLANDRVLLDLAKAMLNLIETLSNSLNTLEVRVKLLELRASGKLED